MSESKKEARGTLILAVVVFASLALDGYVCGLRHMVMMSSFGLSFALLFYFSGSKVYVRIGGEKYGMEFWCPPPKEEAKKTEGVE